MIDEKNEASAGSVIDITCVRTSPADELADCAARHTTGCALMGHRVESGFALVEDGRLHLLEPAATTQVVRDLLATDVGEEFWLRARRECDGEEMRTVDVQPVGVTSASTQGQS